MVILFVASKRVQKAYKTLHQQVQPTIFIHGLLTPIHVTRKSNYRVKNWVTVIDKYPSLRTHTCCKCLFL